MDLISDCRQLVPITQQMSDMIIAHIDGMEQPGDFNVTLTIKRRAGVATCDAAIMLPRNRNEWARAGRVTNRPQAGA